MIAFEILGWFATIMSVAMYAPQTFKTWKSKNTQGVSKLTFIITGVGTGFWTLYTGLQNGTQGMVANFIISLLIIPILYYLLTNKLNFLFVSAIILGISITGITFNFLDAPDIPTWLNIVLVLIAGGGTGMGFFPQVVRTFKTKDPGETSILMMFLIIIANLFWFAWWVGNIQKSTDDVIVSNSLALMFTTFSIVFQIPLVYFKLKK